LLKTHSLLEVKIFWVRYETKRALDKKKLVFDSEEQTDLECGPNSAIAGSSLCVNCTRTKCDSPSPIAAARNNLGFSDRSPHHIYEETT